MPKKPNPRKASDYERHRAESERLGVLDFFEDLIDKGNNPGFAAMLAQRQPPGSKGTERAFLEGMHGWADNVSKECATELHRQAKNAGIATQGKKYIGGLGRPTDPGAWVSTMDDVTETAKRKGLTVTGAINYQAPAQKPKRVRMAEDLVQHQMAVECHKDPGLAEKVKKSPKKMRDLREKVINKHSKPVKE
ncbi:MAG: hypothetical protein CMA83_01215 [Euryarchaeota archaeon]|jgi:hypothetical protein|nr:hypothetical protein [Euryarchaeota archaeon]|tara:strand:- start:9701 stop:10276 length:576 start_codon:yes stop_codon:yes gene_type:complete